MPKRTDHTTIGFVTTGAMPQVRPKRKIVPKRKNPRTLNYKRKSKLDMRLELFGVKAERVGKGELATLIEGYREADPNFETAIKEIALAESQHAELVEEDDTE